MPVHRGYVSYSATIFHCCAQQLMFIKSDGMTLKVDRLIQIAGQKGAGVVFQFSPGQSVQREAELTRGGYLGAIVDVFTRIDGEEGETGGQTDINIIG